MLLSEFRDMTQEKRKSFASSVTARMKGKTFSILSYGTGVSNSVDLTNRIKQGDQISFDYDVLKNSL